MLALAPMLLLFLLLFSSPAQAAHNRFAQATILEPIELGLSTDGLNISTRIRGQIFNMGNQTSLTWNLYVCLLDSCFATETNSNATGIIRGEINRTPPEPIIQVDVDLLPERRYLAFMALWNPLHESFHLFSRPGLLFQIGDLVSIQFRTSDLDTIGDPRTSPLQSLFIGLAGVFLIPANLIAAATGFLILLGMVGVMGLVHADEKAIVFGAFSISLFNVFFGLWPGIILLLIAAIVAVLLIVTFFSGGE